MHLTFKFSYPKYIISATSKRSRNRIPTRSNQRYIAIYFTIKLEHGRKYPSAPKAADAVAIFASIREGHKVILPLEFSNGEAKKETH